MKRRVPFRKTSLGKLAARVQGKWRHLWKSAYWLRHGKRGIPQRVVLIVGCQRSGTTMLGDIFDRDPRAAVLQEDNCLTGTNDRYLRLKPYDEVRKLLAQFREPLVVVKPLVESHRTPEMLREIPASRAVWIYRHYRDVVSSNIKIFSSQNQGLQMRLTGDPPSWRSEHFSQATRELLCRFPPASIPPADAAALGWIAMNNLFFELDLPHNPGVTMCRYADLVARPEEAMRKIYDFLAVDYPKTDLVGGVDSRSMGLGRDVGIRPEIEAHCEELLGRLDHWYETTADRAPAAKST